MSSPLLKIVRHPALLPAWVLALALVTLLPGLGTPGLWEPQEMAVADEAAARHDHTYTTTIPTTQCGKKPNATGARTLTPRAAAWGLDVFASSDRGARLPLALLGIVGAMATFGVAWRLGSARAGFLAGLVLMSFPLWGLSSRQLTSELPTAVGATLLVYGLVALGRPLGKGLGVTVVDIVGALLALVAGSWLAFYGGGVLLGLLPPLAAVAVAGGFGLSAVGVGLIHVWRAIDRRPLRGAAPAFPDRLFILALPVGLITLGLSAWLAYQVFDLGPLTVGSREVFGKSILTSDCWSSALGGVWKGDDDLRATYDSLFEQAGFGMFPWAVLVPIALGALATGLVGERRRHAGAVVLGWAAAAWFVAAVWNRKVGFALYPGFPACAVGVGLWLDALLERRTALSSPTADRGPYAATAWALIGLLVFAGVVVMAKDLSAFPERLTSLLVGSDQIKYPTNARFLFVPMKSWLWVLGLGVALPLAFTAWLWRPPHRAADGRPGALARSGLPEIAVHGVTVALVMTVLTGLFWTHGWHRGLSENLSSKQVFQVYRDARKKGEPLAIMGSMGNAPRYYAGGPTETLTGRDGLLAYLKRPTRVFALVPGSELCPIHAARAEGSSYHVLDDTNARWMLLSNQLGGAKDKNPLVTAMTQEPPEWLRKAGERDLGTWDNQIKLVGVRMPKNVVRGEKFTMTLAFKILAPINGSWKIFAHFDAGGSRFQGDHDPIRGRCQTSFWKVGDYVLDTFEVEAGNTSFAAANYDLWMGFFTGSSGNYHNMTVSAAPEGLKDGNNRIKVASVRLISGRGGCCDAGGDDGATGAIALALGVALVLAARRRRGAA